MKELTQKRLKELLHYSPDTGVFTWRHRMMKRNIPSRRNGKTAGSITALGYIVIVLNYKHLYAHRLAWLYTHGYIPENEIDHINKTKTDNSISNLREVSRSCNAINTINQKNNTSGVKGVYWRKERKKWQARIMVRKEDYYLGMYKSLDNAVCARLAAEQCFSWDDCNSNTTASSYVKKNITRWEG